MNRSDYLSIRAEIKRKHEKELYDHAKKFVLSNVTVKIGDFVKDHVGTIKVETITIAYGFSKDYPEAVYKGTSYTKAGKPFKNGEIRGVWESNRRHI